MNLAFRTLLMMSLALLIAAGDSAALAEQPFFYYPAYGSSRGRIRYVDGVLRNKQRIRWGNGVTDNGVLVMHDLITTAGTVLPAILGPHTAGPTGEDERALRAAAADSQTEDAQLQAKAEAIAAANRQLAERLGLTVEAPFTPLPHGAPAPGRGSAAPEAPRDDVPKPGQN